MKDTIGHLAILLGALILHLILSALAWTNPEYRGER